MNVTDLPLINSSLNAITIIFLLIGYRFIKNNNENSHKKFMLSAVCTSALFLISYLIYHKIVGSVPYPYHDWTRILYFVILIPHIILAALMVPFILLGIFYAFKKKLDKHKKIMKIVLPVWLFVSLSGIVVFLMIYVI